jgi:methionine-rich copper-binding protein CopC
MKVIVWILAGLMLFTVARVADAHSFPTRETPSAGATITTPNQIAITFDAPIEHLFAQLHVLDATGKEIATPPPQIGLGDLVLSVKLPELKPGQYKVEWSVVCIDTHHTNGSYEFTVAGAPS